MSRPPAWRILRSPGVSAGMYASLTLLAAVDILTAYRRSSAEQNGIGPGLIGALFSLRAAASITSRLLVAPMVRSWGRIPLIVASAPVLRLTGNRIGQVASQPLPSRVQRESRPHSG